MDYEQKYKEALKCAKMYYKENKDYNAGFLSIIFPELAEDEDERMLREFNDYLCEEIECRTNDVRDEKDRKTLNMLCFVLKKVDAWLKSLRPRWKPSEKQMEALNALNLHGDLSYVGQQNQLISLYQDLKKLM